MSFRVALLSWGLAVLVAPRPVGGVEALSEAPVPPKTGGSVGVASFERAGADRGTQPDVATLLAQRLGTRGVERVVGGFGRLGDETAAEVERPFDRGDVVGGGAGAEVVIVADRGKGEEKRDEEEGKHGAMVTNRWGFVTGGKVGLGWLTAAGSHRHLRTDPHRVLLAEAEDIAF